MDDEGLEDFNLLSFIKNKNKSTAWIKIIWLIMKRVKLI